MLLSILADALPSNSNRAGIRQSQWSIKAHSPPVNLGALSNKAAMYDGMVRGRDAGHFVSINDAARPATEGWQLNGRILNVSLYTTLLFRGTIDRNVMQYGRMAAGGRHIYWMI
jgi:hypothetical protein